MKKVALHNLGCKVNSYEMDAMQQFLIDGGYEIVDFDQPADIYIINTCTVTNIADRKSRQMLHRAKKQNPEAIVVAVGCYVQTAEGQIEKDACIDLAIGNNRKKDLVAIVEEYLAQADSFGADKTLGGTTVIDINHTDEYEEMQLGSTAEHIRAYIKIQDGCNQFCSYCVIPFARGRVRSRRSENVVAEIEKLAAAGYREVVLTGIHISSYGLDFDGESYNSNREKKGDGYLLDLIRQIHAIDGITRIRLGSLEPRIVTEYFAGQLASLEKVCPHFHLSLQSGCDSVLKRMNRRYTTGEFLERVKILRGAFANPAITTDVITGFPGETEEEFRQTADFLREVGFFEMHVFPYSRREGTAAAQMPGQLTEKEKKNRSALLLQMDKEYSMAYRKAHLGQKSTVLFEQKQMMDGREYWVGHTRNYLKAAVPVKSVEGEALVNTERVCLLKTLLDEQTLLGEALPDNI